MKPVRVQNAVDRQYNNEQELEWQEKVKEVESKVEQFLAREFPEYYKSQKDRIIINWE